MSSAASASSKSVASVASAISVQSKAFIVANRGPLTTIFTPPASCLTETTLISFITTDSLSKTSGSYITTKAYINHFSWGNADCYPGHILTVDGTTRWGDGYYNSPGICPSGWTSACEQRTNALGFSTTLNADTTAIQCCPSNWSCVGGSTSIAAHGCSTVMLVGQTLTNVWAAPSPTPNVAMSIPVSRSLTSWQIQSNTSMVCDAINVLYQQSDVQILALMAAQTSSFLSSSSSSTGQGSSEQTSTLATPTSAPTSNSDNSSSAGLSTGAKAAIGITIPIVFIALIVGIFFFMRRRGQRARNLTHHELPTSASDTQGDWTHLDPMKKSELYSDVPVEADAQQNMHAAELEDSVRRPELSANRSYGNTHEMPPQGVEADNFSSAVATGAASKYVTRKSVGVSPASTPSRSPESFIPTHNRLDDELSRNLGTRGIPSEPSETVTQSSTAADENKLNILRDRIERVRKEKERLNKLNELEAMEEELKMEIMNQQKKTMGF